jgi:hypothetical protein
VGTTVSHEVTKRWGAAGLPDDTIHIQLTGVRGMGWVALQGTRGAERTGCDVGQEPASLSQHPTSPHRS